MATRPTFAPPEGLAPVGLPEQSYRLENVNSPHAPMLLRLRLLLRRGQPHEQRPSVECLRATPPPEVAEKTVRLAATLTRMCMQCENSSRTSVKHKCINQPDEMIVLTNA